MLNTSAGYSQAPEISRAVTEIAKQIRLPELKLIVFFAGKVYDFAALSRALRDSFPGVELIGCTTAGELSRQGFTENSVVALGIAADDFRPASAVIRNIHSIPMLYRREVEKTVRRSGLDPADPNCSKQGFGLLLVDGLQLAEEKVLSVVNSVIKAPAFPLIGGSAGDGLDFKKTLVCLNGTVYNDAAVITFVKTSKKIYLHKEDIFRTTEKSLTVTKANIRERRVYEFDHRPAASAYAAALGISETELPKYFIRNPLGRRIGNRIWTASPFQVQADKSIIFYSQIFPGALVDILDPVDVVAKTRESVRIIKEKIPNLKAVLAINCILRTLQFKDQDQCGKVGAVLAELGQIIGFSSYGEQLGKMQLNQTLVLLALGE